MTPGPTPGATRRPISRLLPLAGLLLAAGVLGVGIWGTLSAKTHLPSAGPPPRVSLSTSQSTSTTVEAPRPHPGSVTTVAPTPSTVPALPSGAVKVTIPDLKMAAPVTAVTLGADDALAVPDNPSTLGWWMPAPSVLVIDGHVDSAVTGPGALFELRSLKPGALIVINTPSGGTEHWRLDGLRTYEKGRLPAELFDQPGPRLVIVTCGGPFDYATHHYYDNVVAYASPA